MTLAIIGCLIGLIIGAVVIYATLKPKIVQVQKLDEEIIHQNAAARAESELLQAAYQQKLDDFSKLNENLELESNRAEQTAKNYYDKMMEIYKKKLDIDIKTTQKNIDTAIAEYQQQYEIVLADSAEGFQIQFEKYQATLNDLQEKITAEQAIVSAAVEANKRAAEMEAKEAFYKLNVPEEDLMEIAALRECLVHLRDPEPLNKVIWKTYYEKPYTDLIGRVVGSGVHCGIYKITNLQNGMCYVGQAVNIADRWKQHIKRGIGAETPTRNKLYPAMLAIGVENFSFEIIEECDRSFLNEKEDYWQEYFKAKEFGYSIK